MSLGTKQHTKGNRTRWVVDYCAWLLPQETLSIVGVGSSSATLTVDATSISLGKEIWFYTNGGVVGETATVTVSVTTSFGQSKINTIEYLVTSP